METDPGHGWHLLPCCLLCKSSVVWAFLGNRKISASVTSHGTACDVNTRCYVMAFWVIDHELIVHIVKQVAPPDSVCT